MHLSIGKVIFCFFFLSVLCSLLLNFQIMNVKWNVEKVNVQKSTKIEIKIPIKLDEACNSHV